MRDSPKGGELYFALYNRRRCK